MSKKIDEIEEALSPIIESCGCQLIEVEYAKEGEDMTLTVFIDKENGVTIDDCERVHNAIDLKVEELDVSNGDAYNLSVSSFGLTRQLKNTKEFLYRLNQEIEVKLFAPMDGEKEFVGLLTQVKDDTIVLNINEKDIEIARKDIASAKLHLDF